jgi:isoquinoline 1-oxidoreductase alpha subunit
MPTYTLTVNGQPRTVEADLDMPLLWVVRDLLHLTGAKFGCGAELCGSCTVHLDCVATRSCVTPVASVGEKKITTIEGLSADGRHPLQQAWLAEQVPQCGYCQAGMIMSAAALLASEPNPTDADIDLVLGQHICRCGTYQRIRRAVHRTAASRKKS